MSDLPPPNPANQPGVAPGWYPVNENSQRYWDGEVWTENIAPLHQQSTSLPEETTYSLIMHLGGIFLSFLVPLIMWLVKRDESDFIDFHGRQALNMHISLFIYGIGSIILFAIGFAIPPVFILAFVLFFAIAIAGLVLGIIAAIKANNGERYRIPLVLQIL